MLQLSASVSVVVRLRLCQCLYFFSDVQVTGVDAVCEQVLGAAGLTGAKHTVVGMEQLTVGRRRQQRAL